MRIPSGSQRDAPVTVTFPIPRKAASKLRTMAVSRDRRLLDLGVLAVQINEGESIVLGIKLGKKRIKNTEGSSEKLRGNASRGRVKKPSTCRNSATIHHMPNVVNAKSPHNLQAVHTANFSSESGEEKGKRAAQPHGDFLGSNLFSNSSKIVGNPSNNSCKFRVSDFCASSQSKINGQSSSAKLSAHQNKRQNNSSYAVNESQGSNVQQAVENPSESPAMITSRTASVESYYSAAQTLSSPSSQRAYSASPSSDTSSASSEENFDSEHDQLIYSCFVDKTKYSATDVLKELAKTHAAKKSTSGNKALRAVKSSAATTKSSPGGNCLLYTSTGLDNNGRSRIPGSYRDHVKNIRCNSLTTLTTCTSSVNSTLKLPVTSTDQALGFQNEQPSTIGDEIHNELTQHSSHRIALSKPSTASQTKSMKTSTSKPGMYCSGRKVLWSSSNAFPRHTTSSAHFPIHKSNTSFPELNSPSSKNGANLHSQVQETTSTASAALCSDASKSAPTDTQCSIHKLNTLFGKDLVNESNTTQLDSKTIRARIPSLSSDSKESVAMQNPNPSTTASTRSIFIPAASNVVQTESSSTTAVENLTMQRPTISAPVVVAGTNTQTTWSNQQVSPTYFVGAQGQYGIYSALYSPEVNKNQLGQQAVTAAYPLNYVYPLSFVYPYLAMAQANSVKSLQSDKREPQNGNLEVIQADALTNTTNTTNAGPGGNAKELTQTTAANLQLTSSSVTPTQTQFIDLASSMRYWQQLSLLYRSRLALASCNLSNISAMSSSQVSTTATATSTDSVKSTESPVTAAGNDTSVKSNSEELSFCKPEISQVNSSQESRAEKMRANDLSKENAYSQLLQHVKPGISLEEENGLKDKDTNDRPSVIIASSCKEKWDSVSEAQTSPVKLPSKQETDDNGIKSSNSVLCQPSSAQKMGPASFYGDRLRHMDDDGDGDMEGSMPAGRRLYGSPPKLSFIHDSSIACVNVGNSNGFGGIGSYTGARRTGRSW